MGAGSLRLLWEARHYGYVRDRQFCDEQVRGPFKIWRHTHVFEPIGPDQTLYEDRVEYAVPGGPFVNWIAGPVVRRLLTRLFEFRHQVVHAKFAAPRRASRIRRDPDATGLVENA